MEDKKTAILLLEDGAVFHGTAIGKIGTTTGEIDFNTGMTGYQEVFTDPSYYGQVLVMNTAHIGNYGTKENEIESDGMKISGLVVKKFSDGYSRPSGTMSLNDYMIENDVVGHQYFDQRASNIKQVLGAVQVSENVAYNYQSNEGVLNAWLLSDGHKDNIEGDFTHFGISVKTNPNTGKKYYTNIFMKR